MCLKSVKAIGWFIEEYGVAQISMNLTDIDVTPAHMAFDAVSDSAQARGVLVTGSELVGLMPLSAMLEAGRHYLRKQLPDLAACLRGLADGSLTAKQQKSDLARCPQKPTTIQSKDDD